MHNCTYLTLVYVEVSITVGGRGLHFVGGSLVCASAVSGPSVFSPLCALLIVAVTVV